MEEVGVVRVYTLRELTGVGLGVGGAVGLGVGFGVGGVVGIGVGLSVGCLRRCFKHEIPYYYYKLHSGISYPRNSPLLLALVLVLAQD